MGDGGLDRSDFELALESNIPRVRAYLLRRANDPGQVDEVLSETLEIAWSKRSERPDKPLAWMIAIARRCLANDFRRHRTRQDLLGRLQAAWVPEGDESRAIRREDLVGALASLSEDDREAILLVAWDGLSSGEAAKVLGCSRTTFYVRAHRARSRLREQLELREETPGQSKLKCEEGAA